MDTHTRRARDPGPDWRIETLWRVRLEDARVRGGELPRSLQSRFDGRLEIPVRPDRPTLVANFVATLDGVVAFERDGRYGGAEVSGWFEPDRFLMATLRALSDAVLVGAGTVRANPTHAWTPRRIHPPSAAALAEWRQRLGVAGPAPATLIVTSSGAVDADRVVARDPEAPVIVLTTEVGAARLRDEGGARNAEIVVLAGDGRLPVPTIRRFVAERGWAVVLSEAGPNLFGELLAGGAVDELFLTLAPQLAGRSESVARLGLVEGIGFAAAGAPWSRLRSVLRCGDHLFLRYVLDRPAERPGEAT